MNSIKERKTYKTIGVSPEVWRKAKRIAVDLDSTIGEIIERSLDLFDRHSAEIAIMTPDKDGEPTPTFK